MYVCSLASQSLIQPCFEGAASRQEGGKEWDEGREGKGKELEERKGGSWGIDALARGRGSAFL